MVNENCCSRVIHVVSHSRYFYLSWNFHISNHLENRSQRVYEGLLYLSHIQTALSSCKLTPLNWSKPVFTKQSKLLSGRKTESVLEGSMGLWLCQHTEFHIYVQNGFAYNLHIEWLRIIFTVGECSVKRSCNCSILSCWGWYPGLCHTTQDLYHWTNPHHPVISIKIMWLFN